MAVLVVLLSLLYCLKSSAWDGSKYACSMCVTLLEDIRKLSSSNKPNLREACANRFTKLYCDSLYSDIDMSIMNSIDYENKSSRQICFEYELCPQPGKESWEQYHPLTSEDVYDIRVSKALGSRGYDKVSWYSLNFSFLL